MKTKSTISTLAVALVLLAAIWMAWPGPEGPTPAVTDGSSATPAAAAQTDPVATEVTVPSQPRREETRLPTVERATTGDLLVRVRYADEPRPAAEVPVTLHRAGGDFRVDILRGRTDASGAARFDAVPVGNWVANTSLALNPRRIEVIGGELTEVVLDLSRGMDLTGIVVDDAGAPVASALIEVGRPLAGDPVVMATTRADGTFALRACPRNCLVGARAAGYAASAMLYVRGNEEASQHIRLELVAPGGVVEGLVVCRDGEPVGDAVVRVGDGPTDHLMALVGGSPPLPAQVRTDGSGMFRAIGVPVGEQPVQVRAAGFAPWRGSCVVAANMTVPLRVVLTEGGRCEGSVLTADGAPVADASVRLGAKGDFLQLFARTDSNGSFTMADLPDGEVELRASDDEHGETAAKVDAVAGRTVRCELRFPSAHDLRGRVIDEAGEPVAGLHVRVVPEEGGEPVNDRTDREGRFVVPSLSGGALVTVNVSGSLIDAVRRTDIDPAAGEVTLRVRVAPRSAIIRGVVLDADGMPVPDIDVDAFWKQTGDSKTAMTGVDGSFEVGPLRAGRWQLQVAKDGCARYRSPVMTLDEYQTVDLGTIRLCRGGTILVGVVGAPAERLRFVIYTNEGDLVHGMLSTVVPLRSPPLHPGGYALQVRGEGLAAMRLPFTIRDGQETELAVAVEPGTRQRFEFRFSSGQAPNWFVFHVRRGESVLLSEAASARDGFVVDRWFAPGDYEVLVNDDALKGEARFTVGREPGPPLIVHLH